jgi:hypothetical protein
MLVGFLSELFSNTLKVLHSVTVKDKLKLKALASHVHKTVKTIFLFKKRLLDRSCRERISCT